MQKLLFVFGTRPEAIKLAPVLLAARAHPQFEVVVCVTAQHRAMLDSVLGFFSIEPEFDLNLMQPGQSLTGVNCGALAGLEPLLAQLRPDWMIVQGDTTTAFAAALAAFYARVKVAHVEAGLRTGNMQEPFPEELNRKLVAVIASLHFAPTALARANLLGEGVPAHAISVTGNTGIDALYLVRRQLARDPQCRDQVDAALAEQGLAGLLTGARRFVLITAHRRESFGAGFESICSAIGALCARYPEIVFVFPVHPNPAVRRSVSERLAPGTAANLLLCEPLDYLPFVALMLRAALVLTDSGGVQEEAPSLGTPVVVMRDLTERTEGAGSGLVRLAGPHHERIVDAVSELLEQAAPGGSAANYYGDGHASARILERLSGFGEST